MSMTMPSVPFPICISPLFCLIFQNFPVDKFVNKQLYIDLLLTSIH